MPWDSFRKKKEGTKRKDEHQTHPTTSSGSSTPRAHHADHRVSALTKEVVQKIKEVDRETSTLTHSGVQGLSSRVLDRYDYLHTMPDGTQQMCVCQTVELVKKPGQSLGLYLREGNGVERSDGVFVSRLAEGEALEKSGVLKAGDEILSVNNVNVTQMSIDDVVVMISIPQRLLLKTRFLKCSLDQSGAGRPNVERFDKPVVVLKQMAREESRESTFTDDGGPLAGSKPMPTSQTSLGAKLRQQESNSGYDATSEKNPIERKLTLPSTSAKTLNRPHAPPQRAHSDKWNYTRQLTMHAPRVLDSEGRTLEVPSATDEWPGGEPINRGSPFLQSTLSQTAYLPPPKLQSKLPNPTGRPTGPSLSDAQVGQWMSDDMQQQQQTSLFSPRSVLSDSAAVQSDLFASYQDNAFYQSGSSVGAPRSALRQPSAFPMTAVYPSMKSNSLPRRQPGRTIRWRNDVNDGTIPSNIQVQAPADYSDSDGAISAPELPISPMNLMQPQFAADNRGRSRAMRNVEDEFSRAEYRAWSMSSNPPQQQPMDAYYPCQADSLRRAYVNYDQLQHMLVNNQGTLERSFPPPAAFEQQVNYALPSTSWNETCYDNNRTFDRPYLSLSRNNRNLKSRSSSLPPRGVLNSSQMYAFQQDDRCRQPTTIDVSPLPHRRLPLRLAEQQLFGLSSAAVDGGLTSSSGVNVPSSLTGTLLIHIIEGRNLRAHERGVDDGSIEMYTVIEVDGEHRARTEVSDASSQFHWNETFEIDVWECRQADFYIYSWHPQYRHKLKHRGCLQLVEAILTGQLENQGQCFALSLEPKGQLLIRVGFHSMLLTFRRQLAIRRNAYWGIPLANLIERENTGCTVPIVLKRMIEEIDRRGVDTIGLYMLCGSVEKKLGMRHDLEKDPANADLSPDAVPDMNLINSLVKDFLRELPEPLIPGCTYQMLIDAWRVCLPNDREGNARLMLGVLDCLPRANKCTAMVLMDHLKYVMSQSPHNGLSSTKLSIIFGPLLLCSSQPTTNGESRHKQSQVPLNFLDYRLAARLLEFLLELWPSRNSSSESSGSENSTLNLTSNGSTSLVDLWLQENRIPESTC